jgi:hypothetical protein
MPKAKKIIKKTDDKEETKDETKEILLDDEDKVALDPELIAGDAISDDEDGDDDALVDDEEVDPFKDRWEE